MRNLSNRIIVSLFEHTSTVDTFQHLECCCLSLRPNIASTYQRALVPKGAGGGTPTLFYRQETPKVCSHSSSKSCKASLSNGILKKISKEASGKTRSRNDYLKKEVEFGNGGDVRFTPAFKFHTNNPTRKNAVELPILRLKRLQNP